MRDEIKRDFYIKDIAERFSIYESIIRKELDKSLKLKSKGLTREVPQKPEYEQQIRESVSKVSLIELMLIRLLIDSDKETKSYLTENLEIDLILHNEAAKILNYIMMNLDKPEKISHVNLFNEFQDEVSKDIIGKALLDENYVMQENKSKNYIDDAKFVINKLKLGNVTAKRSDILTKLKSANSYSQEALDLLTLKGSLDKEISLLKKELKAN
jgi:hypothetical protein